MQEALFSALFADLDGKALDLLAEGVGVGPVALLGDDLRDGVAFRAVSGGVAGVPRYGGRTLVRPPWELSGFLER
jgi:hypothetical protein